MDCKDIEDYYEHDDSFHSIKEDELSQIANSIVKWYQINRRKLPWRGDQPPYSKTAEVKTTTKRDAKQSSLTSFFTKKKQKTANTVIEKKVEEKTYDFVNAGITSYTEYVSEIMLQQTQVDTVIEKYLLWMQKYPTIQDLAKATEEDVNSLWSGLGYYRRAQYLLKGAKYIVDKCNGEIPTTKEALLKVPGIGEYTAGAILAIACNKPEAAVDGNVMRVLSRLRAVYQIKSQKAFLNWCWQTAGLLVKEANPSDYTQGIMELGAVVCTPHSPSCSTCPLQKYCKAYKLIQKQKKDVNTEDYIHNTHCSICCDYPKHIPSIDVYPVAKQTKEVPTEYYSVLVLESESNPGSYYLHKRAAKILTGQLEPLLIEVMERFDEETAPEIAKNAIQTAFSSHIPSLASTIKFHGLAKHVFSHRIHQLAVCSATVNESTIKPINDYEWYNHQRIQDMGTTTWFLLMLKTAKKSVVGLKKLAK